MLLNRISLRVASAVGSAAVVAGAAFAVTAFADQGAEPQDSAAAVVPDAAGGSQQYFANAEQISDEELKQQRDDTRDRIDDASGAVNGSSTTKEKEKEEPEEPADTGGGGSGGGGGAAASGDPKATAESMLGDFGWSADEFSCLEPLWEKESGWDHTAENSSSGAYGIPQALPGSKMSSAGSDWQTNPATQIEWGLGYIEDRYGSPCEAWNHSQANGWY